jgi:hypothetical protein
MTTYECTTNHQFVGSAKKLSRNKEDVVRLCFAYADASLLLSITAKKVAVAAGHSRRYANPGKKSFTIFVPFTPISRSSLS